VGVPICYHGPHELRIRLEGRKINQFYPEILPLSDYDEESSLCLLSKYLLKTELRFDAMLYSSLGDENSDAGHINFSRRPQVPHPCVRESPHFGNEELALESKSEFYLRLGSRGFKTRKMFLHCSQSVARNKVWFRNEVQNVYYT